MEVSHNMRNAPTKAPKNSRIQCLDRALDIIEAVAARGEAGATELAQALGLHVATTHNILATLAARHYLTNEGGRYRIGPSLGMLEGRWNPVALLPRLARPHLEAITRATGESAVATLLLGEMAVLVATTIGSNEVTAQHPQGVHPDPLGLATGRVLAAHERDARRRALIGRHVGARFSDEAQASREAERLDEVLAQVRREGLAVIHNPGGIYALGAPVRIGEGAQVVAAVGASCPAFRATEAHQAAMQDAVLAAASALSAQL